MNEGDSAGGGHRGSSSAPPAVQDRRSSSIFNSAAKTAATTQQLATNTLNENSATKKNLSLNSSPVSDRKILTGFLDINEDSTPTTSLSASTLSATDATSNNYQQSLSQQLPQQQRFISSVIPGSSGVQQSIKSQQYLLHMPQKSTTSLPSLISVETSLVGSSNSQKQLEIQQRVLNTNTSTLSSSGATLRPYSSLSPREQTEETSSPLAKRQKYNKSPAEASDNTSITPQLSVVGSLLPKSVSSSSTVERGNLIVNFTPSSTAGTPSTRSLKKLIEEEKFLRLRKLKERYPENVAEWFYLQSGSPIMELSTWRKKPPTPQFISFNNACRLDQLANEEHLSSTSAQANPGSIVSSITSHHEQQPTAENIATIIGVTSGLHAQALSSANTTDSQSLGTANCGARVANIQGSSSSSLIKRDTQSGATATTTSGTNQSLRAAQQQSEDNTVESNLPQNAEIKIPAVGATPVAVSTKLPDAVIQLTQQGHIPGRPLGGRHGMVFGHITTPSAVGNTSSIPLVPGGTPLVPCSTGAVPVALRRNGNGNPAAAAALPNAGPAANTQSLYTTATNGLLVPASSGATSPGGSNIQEFSVKAKQEVYVMQRVSELQREGLWTERRLPKLQEPSRPKAHWDYLLEEMVWLAADFAQERKWKKNAAKKCARMVQKYFQDKANAAQKAEKAQEAHLRRVAAFIAKEVKIFWSNVEKLVEYKHHTKLEEKRKKALDQHLSFIVDQTEKFSQQLAEGMNRSIADAAGNSATTSANVSRMASPKQDNLSDDDFRPETGSEDDEETIAKAEEEATDVKEEVAALEKESQMDLDDFLKDLPPGYLENRDKLISEEESKVTKPDNFDGDDDDPMEADSNDADEHKTITRKPKSNRRLETDVDDDDAEFEANESSDDDENTISKQEEEEMDVDHKKELDDLEADNDLTVEELLAKYHSGRIDDEQTTSSSSVIRTAPKAKTRSRNKSALDSDDEESDENAKIEKAMRDSGDSTADDGDDDNDGDDDDDDDAESDQSSGDELSSENEENENEAEDENGLKSLVQDERANKDEMIKDAAALAESIQPKGNTLSSTNVVTPVPALLKHTLREYQHIGLDWLVTMYERKLNGILADEMGLGKTIQTIALLAHLACVKGNWGPHLIVVPSSVMLNWEMEFKKWCPGFKILTYYGSQKERKMKRVGWTKPNAFHVCITSYKLVIQDQQSFRRKKWKYLILDEAQNIKNFKSQRWQLLLNFSTERRLLLTGTPLQNDLMELWSLMHFLMPYVFSSHREFKEWFSNPMTGMIEGNTEYNEALISRLHKVIRPFLLRRLKKEVEKQMPKKYEHVVMCRLSNRQRYLYDDFMSRAKTKETLQTGNLLSVINVLMQLRKVCNHPNMFEVRPTISPFQMDGILYQAARLICDLMEYDPFTQIDLHTLNLVLIQLELTLTAYASHRSSRLGTPRKLIEEIDSMPELPPRCPSGKFKFHIRVRDADVQKNLSRHHAATAVRVGASPAMKTEGNKLVPICSKGTTQTQSQLGKRLSNINPVNMPRLKLIEFFDDKNIVAKRTVSGLTTTTAPATTTSIVRDASSINKTGVKVTIQSNRPQNIGITTAASSSGGSSSGSSIYGGGSNFGRVTLSTIGGRFTLQKTASVSSTPGITAITSNYARIDNRKSENPLLINTLAKEVKSTNDSKIKMEIDGDNNNDKKRDNLVDENTSEADPVFNMVNILKQRKAQRLSRLKLMAEVNRRRLDAIPIYGEDCRESMQKFGSIPNRMLKYSTWHSRSYINCRTASARKDVWSLTKILKSYEQRCEELREIFANFVFYVPSACAPRIRFYVQNLTSASLQRQRECDSIINNEMSPKLSLLHPIISAMTTQFPDPRLIQYDCGKLQILNTLLRRLKAEQHRVLIFTQMTKMLDVLEAFLNYHGHIYLRLDGSTRIEQRQILMERFNGDKRIFCFILSTRSGGVGINLTGADTVIFYDSDWNPTMDAQAQDRCHRIGQTRDVHIYRLVSEKTIEVNILKKANQKRMLSDMAIEGGNFTASYFKSTTIKDLFNIEQNEQDTSTATATASASATQLQEIPMTVSSDKDKVCVVSGIEKSQNLMPNDLVNSTVTTEIDVEKHALRAFESALAEAEDDQDVQAAKTAKAEAAADLAEFDETIPIEETTMDVAPNTEMSKADLEMQNLVKQLSPIERYAMRFVEETGAAWTAEQLRAVEAEIEAQKREWEANRLAAIRKEEELLKQEVDADVMLTYNRKDALNQVNKNNSRQLNCLKARNAKLLKRSRVVDNKKLQRSTRRVKPNSRGESISKPLRRNFRKYPLERRDVDNVGGGVSDEENDSVNESLSDNVKKVRSRVTRSGNRGNTNNSKVIVTSNKKGVLKSECDSRRRTINGKDGRRRNFSPMQSSNRKTTRSSTAAAGVTITASGHKNSFENSTVNEDDDDDKGGDEEVVDEEEEEEEVGNDDNDDDDDDDEDEDDDDDENESEDDEEDNDFNIAARQQNKTGVKDQNLLKFAAKRRAINQKSDDDPPRKRSKQQKNNKRLNKTARKKIIDFSTNDLSEDEHSLKDVAGNRRQSIGHGFTSDLDEVLITDNEDDEGNFYGIPSEDETTQIARSRQHNSFYNISFGDTSDAGEDKIYNTARNLENAYSDDNGDGYIDDNGDDADGDEGNHNDNDTRSSYATAGDDENDEDKETWNVEAQMQDTNATNSTYYNVSEETESDERDSITPASRMLSSGVRRSGTPNSIGNTKKSTTMRRTATSSSQVTKMNSENQLNFEANEKNSPRTRSRGSVKINLWTLDESHALTDIIRKPRTRTLSEMGIVQHRNKVAKTNINDKQLDVDEAKVDNLREEANSSDVESASANPVASKLNINRRKSLKRESQTDDSNEPNKPQVNTLHRWLLKTPQTTRAQDAEVANVKEHRTNSQSEQEDDPLDDSTHSDTDILTTTNTDKKKHHDMGHSLNGLISKVGQEEKVS